MSKEEISFEFVWIPTDYWSKGNDPAGVLFHKWLPDGEKDAICLIDQGNIKLHVLFERRGFLDKDEIKYSDEKKEELKENVIRRHAKLESGPLFIKLVYPIGLNDEKKIIGRDVESKTAKYDKLNDYDDLGKNIYKLIYSKLSVLVYTLKYKFGQFWIEDFPSLDSTSQSLGSYFSGLQAKCIIKGKKYRFLPNSPIVFLVSKISKDDEFLKFITEDNWRSLQKKEFIKENTGREYLVKSYDSYINNDLRNAFLEGCIALELVISNLFVKFCQEKLDSFFDMPRKVQLCIVANLVLPDLTESIITNSCKAIDIRNSIMHKGYVPNSRDSKYYIDLINVVIKLLRDGEIKLPNKHLGQIIWTK